MAQQDYLYPKVPVRDSDGVISAIDQEKFNRNILELIKNKVSNDNKRNNDVDESIVDSSYEIATESEAQAGTDDTKIITPLKLRNGLNAEGSAPIYACRAWVNFNGTGTVAIRDSGNVSSITDVGVGTYTVNYTVALEDENYSVFVSFQRMASWVSTGIQADTRTANSARIFIMENNTQCDSSHINFCVIR